MRTNIPIYVVLLLLTSTALDTCWNPPSEKYDYNCNQLARQGVALSFDDSHNLDEWNDTRSYFAEHNITATFFIDNWGRHTTEQSSIIKALDDDGHEIGFHGANHKNYRDYLGNDEAALSYYEHEILPGTRLMEEAGYDSQSFAYPMGSRDVVIDGLILQNYSVLRGIRWNEYGSNSWSTACEDGGVFRALNLNVLDDDPELLFDELYRLADEERTLLLYGHSIGDGPGELDLNDFQNIVDIMAESNVPWLRMSELGQA